MKKKLLSFRADEDIAVKLPKLIKKIPNVTATDIINASVYQFVSSNKKKQAKYLKNYMARLFEDV
jgi:hypothetical protein